MAVISLGSRPAEAHTLGLSESRVRVHPSGRIESTVALATFELAQLAPVDHDRDGVVEQIEIDQANEHFEKLVQGLVVIQADGEPCPARWLDTRRGDDGDGADIDAEHQCVQTPRNLHIEVPLIASLPPTHSHRLRVELIRTTGDVETHEISLGGAERRLDLPTGYTQGPSGIAVAATAAGIMALGLLLLRARRVAGPSLP